MVLAKLPNLQSLVFGPLFNNDAQFMCFPENLQHLTFGKDFNRSLMHVTRLLNKKSLEVQLRFVKKNPNLWLQIELWDKPCRAKKQKKKTSSKVNFPANLKTLTFGDRFNQILRGIRFPHTLQTLTLGFAYNQSLQYNDMVLPDGLQELIFGYNYNQSLCQVKLPSLKKLSFGFSFDQCMDEMHLPSLEDLRFSGKFNHSLATVKLPMIQHLTLSHAFQQSLDFQEFSALQSLKLGDNFNDSALNLLYLSRLQSLEMGAKLGQKHRENMEAC